jgi:hypothetical protein
MKKEILIAIAAGVATVGLIWALSKIQVNLTVAPCNCGEVGVYDDADTRQL